MLMYDRLLSVQLRKNVAEKRKFRKQNKTKQKLTNDI